MGPRQVGWNSFRSRKCGRRSGRVIKRFRQEESSPRVDLCLRLHSCPVGIQVRRQVVASQFQITVAKGIRNLLVPLHATLPIATRQAATKAVEEDRQQVMKRQEW